MYLDEAYRAAGLFEGTESRSLSLFFHHWAVRALHPPLLRAILWTSSALARERPGVFPRVAREAARRPARGRAADPKKGSLISAARSSRCGPGWCRTPCRGQRARLADYIVFSTFQWARSVSPLRLLEPRRSPVRVARADDGPLRRLCGKGEGLSGVGIGVERSLRALFVLDFLHTLNFS